MELRGLRAVRTRRLMTQGDLAEATGLTKTSISRLETGTTRARISTVRKLIAALHVELDELTTIDPLEAGEVDQTGMKGGTR